MIRFNKNYIFRQNETAHEKNHKPLANETKVLLVALLSFQNVIKLHL